MFYSALADDALKKVFLFPVERKHRGKDIKFENRTGYHKIARVLYKFFRGLYVSLMFYMSPFFVFAIVYQLGDTKGVSDQKKLNI